MYTETKVEQLITKLIRETASNSIHWTITNPPSGLTNGTDDIVPLFLQTWYKDTPIGIYQKRFRSFIDEHEFYWSEQIGFCLFDTEGRVAWELEERSPALFELFRSAREQASGIGNLLDNLLSP